MAMVSAIFPASSERTRTLCLVMGIGVDRPEQIAEIPENRPDHYQGVGHRHALAGPEPLGI